MRYFILLPLLVAWALWLGATIATFIFAIHLFHVNYEIAGPANTAMFQVFGNYELILAAACLFLAGAVLIDRPSGPVIALLALLLVSSAMAVTSSQAITPHLAELAQDQTNLTKPEFKKLHKQSGIVMTIQAATLLAGGWALAATISRSWNRVK